MCEFLTIACIMNLKNLTLNQAIKTYNSPRMYSSQANSWQTQLHLG